MYIVYIDDMDIIKTTVLLKAYYHLFVNILTEEVDRQHCKLQKYPFIIEIDDATQQKIAKYYIDYDALFCDLDSTLTIKEKNLLTYLQKYVIICNFGSFVTGISSKS